MRIYIRECLRGEVQIDAILKFHCWLVCGLPPGGGSSTSSAVRCLELQIPEILTSKLGPSPFNVPPVAASVSDSPKPFQPSRPICIDLHRDTTHCLLRPTPPKYFT